MNLLKSTVTKVLGDPVRHTYKSDDGTLKKIKFSDVLKEQNDDIDREDIAQRFDADFALFTGEMTRLIDSLIDSLGGEASC